MEKEKLKEQCLKMYLEEGKTLEEISKLTNWSRKYITDLIKNDPKYKSKRNNRKMKVYKKKYSNQMLIYVPTDFIEKLGVSRKREKAEYVDVTFDEQSKSIIIKKHS